jgi:cytochrome c biogenesis protein CcmG, thiol:disulfide interchange protein DsbE
MKIILLLLILFLPTLAQEPQEPKAPRKPPTLYRIQSGDLDGDKRSEVITWDSETKELVVTAYLSGQAKKLASRRLENFPTMIEVADLDGDGKGELIIGEGLRGYNPKTGPQTDVQLRIYKPLDKDGWAPVEVFRQATERPEVTSLEIVDLDGDKKPEILFAYFAEKYQVDIRIARRQGDGWKIEQLPRVRMGTDVTVGDVLGDKKKRLVVGRPYGEDLRALGGAFVVDGEARIELPAFRGVSSIALGDLDRDGQIEIVIGDGWHYDYGKVARGRLAVIKYVEGKWDYQLIEDIPENVRIREIALADLNRDGKPEIIAHGERRNSLGGDVRIYQRTSTGWRGMTAATNVQGFALGKFTSGKPELIFAGAEPRLMALDLRRAKWDAKLAEEVETYKIDPATLIGNPAPRLQAEEWKPGDPLTLEKLKGKVVMLDFWATWCKPCIAQFPVMREWQAKYGPQGLVIIGMTNHSSQTSEDVRAFLDKHKLPWVVAIDPRDRTHMDYGVSPIPHTFLIDRSGIVRMSHVGGKDLQEVEKQIEALLAAPSKVREL